MLSPCRLAALLAVATAVSLAAQPLAAQPLALRASTPRVLFAASDSVKLDDGQRGRLVTVVTYDPVAGAYVTERTANGVPLPTVVQRTSHIGPTPDEEAAAEVLVRSHPDLAARIAGAPGRVFVQGGFPLVREPGHACGPGGRCVMYDVYALHDGETRRLGFAIVDLRLVRVLDADADSNAETNLANPAARRLSRRR